MGIALWAASGIAAFLIARNVPAGRSTARRVELLLAIVAALLLGVVATALDFGGWRELEWRAGVLCFLGAFAALGAWRLVRLIRTT